MEDEDLRGGPVDTFRKIDGATVRAEIGGLHCAWRDGETHKCGWGFGNEGWPAEGPDEENQEQGAEDSAASHHPCTVT
jgi:hypothetical protein